MKKKYDPNNFIIDNVFMLLDKKYKKDKKKKKKKLGKVSKDDIGMIVTENINESVDEYYTIEINV